MSALRITGNSADLLAPVLAARKLGVQLEVEVADGTTILTTPAGEVASAAAAMRTVAASVGNSEFCGSTPMAAAQVDQWVDFANLTVAPRLRPLLAKSAPALLALVNMGVRFSSYQAELAAAIEGNADAAEALQRLDTHLAGTTFLAGERVTLADVATLAAVLDTFTLTMADGGPYKALFRWVRTMLADADVRAAMAACKLQRGGAIREGGQIDLRPVPARVSAAADSSIERNVGQKKKQTQRQAEKAAKEDGGEGDAAPAAAAGGQAGQANAAATAAVPPTPAALPGATATEEQPASNQEGVPAAAKCHEVVSAAMAAVGAPMELREHAPVTNMAEYAAAMEGVEGVTLCKNLFIKAKKGKDKTDSRMWLVIAAADTDTNLKHLGKELGYGKIVLRFGDDKTLRTNLGSAKGHVSPFALLNDTALQVNVALDASLMGAQKLAFHPLHNQATVTLTPQQLVALVAHTGHAHTVVTF